MTTVELFDKVKDLELYNLHSHTEYCDGHAPMREMVAAACEAGFKVWGVTPHAPICVHSECNMRYEDAEPYLARIAELREEYAGRMLVLGGMEVDFISRDFGPHVDYFHELPLDYRIGSVHFVPRRDGISIDCDGSVERFRKSLMICFRNDLRYVVEKYYEQVLTMLELGGFEVLGHFDKIAGNASAVDPDIESYGWYQSLVDDVISHAASNGCLVEVNTKAFESRNRFYPAEWLWPRLKEAGLRLVVNSDAHWKEKVNAGRHEAFIRMY